MEMEFSTLVLFTRFPEPGTTKTRLIPHLGAEGAAALQRAMTGHTVLRARLWVASHGDACVVVRYTGASKASFKKWLGEDLVFHEQGDGDLGERMQRAVLEALEAGTKKVILLGCDCPDAGPDVLDEAFRALDTHDVVIGPAQDGGYYLIGMKQLHAALFQKCDWGTERVYAQTQQIIRDQGLACKELMPLHDVDEAESLPCWQRQVQPMQPGSVSVVIPALNEAAHIAACVESARDGASEVIVVDGGSADDTRSRAEAAGAVVSDSPRGRAVQMNQGAYAARGEYLLFLHADSRLPDGYAERVRSVLQEKHSTVGAFSLRIDACGLGYRLVEWGVRQRCRWWRLPYGDQALFVRRACFFETGGFAQLPLMEDVEWLQRAICRSRLCLLSHAVQVSARRWERLGLLRTTLLNQRIWVAAKLGIPNSRLAEWYRR